MKKDLTEIICVIDKSGSMDSLKSDAIGGFNSFLESQKKLPGSATLTAVLFDTSYEFLSKGIDIQQAPALSEENYVPGGMTALIDALGRTIDDVGKRLADTDESDRPEKIIVVIITDGEENSSTEYNHKQVMDKITHQRDKYSWEFIFLAAGQDAIEAAASIGISKNFAYNFTANAKGVSSSYGGVNMAVTSYRSTGEVDTEAVRNIVK